MRRRTRSPRLLLREAGDRRSVSGRLTPFSASQLGAVPNRAWAISDGDLLEDPPHARGPPIFPSSNQMASPGWTSLKTSGRVTPMRAGSSTRPCSSRAANRPAIESGVSSSVSPFSDDQRLEAVGGCPRRSAAEGAQIRRTAGVFHLPRRRSDRVPPRERPRGWPARRGVATAHVHHRSRSRCRASPPGEIAIEGQNRIHGDADGPHLRNRYRGRRPPVS